MSTATAERKENFTVEADLLESQEVEALFGRKWLTLLNWRKERGMPYVLVPTQGKRVVRYRLNPVLAWARKEKITVDEQRLERIRTLIKERKEAA